VGGFSSVRASGGRITLREAMVVRFVWRCDSRQTGEVASCSRPQDGRLKPHDKHDNSDGSAHDHELRLVLCIVYLGSVGRPALPCLQFVRSTSWWLSALAPKRSPRGKAVGTPAGPRLPSPIDFLAGGRCDGWGQERARPVRTCLPAKQRDMTFDDGHCTLSK
jgi:hypothetical protein